MRLVAVDLWGGAWVNNTRSCVRWYERPGQGLREHVGFAALHALHPAVIAVVDHSTGARSGVSALRWMLAHYGWMVVSAVAIAQSSRRRRLPIAFAAAVVGLVLDRALESSPAAGWFAPVYYAKLLIGHAAGSIWNAGKTVPN